jgi:hypothetical protein
MSFYGQNMHLFGFVKCPNFNNSLAAGGRKNSREIDTLEGINSNKIDTLRVSCSNFVVLCYRTETLEYINVFFMLWRIIFI